MVDDKNCCEELLGMEKNWHSPFNYNYLTFPSGMYLKTAVTSYVAFISYSDNL